MITQEVISSILKQQFHENIQLRRKRPNIYQVIAPFFHEDGDMLDMYVAPSNENEDELRLCDFGKTLMRLSYTFELDTDNKRRIFKELLRENEVEFEEASGNIFIATSAERLAQDIFHFSQVIAKVSRLDVLRREVVSGLFFEILEQFIKDTLKPFNPEFSAQPLEGRDDLEVTCAFYLPKKPVLLFAVRSSSQARLAALSFLEFQRSSIPFTGCVVHDDFDLLPSKDRKRLTSAADKQFPSLEDFRENAVGYLTREAA